MLRRVLLLTILSAAGADGAIAQQNRIDLVTPLAPELAHYGQYDIGAHAGGHGQEPSGCPEYQSGSRRGGIRPYLDPRGLVSGGAWLRAATARRVPGDHPRPVRHSDAARQSGA